MDGWDKGGLPRNGLDSSGGYASGIQQRGMEVFHKRAAYACGSIAKAISQVKLVYNAYFVRVSNQVATSRILSRRQNCDSETESPSQIRVRVQVRVMTSQVRVHKKSVLNRTRLLH